MYSVARHSIVAITTPSFLNIPIEAVYGYFGIALSAISITKGPCISNNGILGTVFLRKGSSHN